MCFFECQSDRVSFDAKLSCIYVNLGFPLFYNLGPGTVSFCVLKLWPKQLTLKPSQLTA